MSRILLVVKRPLAERLPGGSLERLEASGAMSGVRLLSSADRQRVAIAQVRAALTGHELREVLVHQLKPDDAGDAELVVTAGGDGTVFTANLLDTEAPFLTVNSDPDSSLGHFTRATAADVPRLVAAFAADRGVYEAMPRLRCRTPTAAVDLLNDALFTNVNPAAMSRYLIDDGATCEKQRSSGVWVSTAAGSTGAIRSAGAEPMPGRHDALLWRVREPFHAFGRLRMLEGRQVPPRCLVLTASIPGMAIYIDGPNLTLPVGPGETAAFTASARPLRLLTGEA